MTSVSQLASLCPILWLPSFSSLPPEDANWQTLSSNNKHELMITTYKKDVLSLYYFLLHLLHTQIPKFYGFFSWKVNSGANVSDTASNYNSDVTVNTYIFWKTGKCTLDLVLSGYRRWWIYGYTRKARA